MRTHAPYPEPSAAQVMVPWAHTPNSPVLHAAVLLGSHAMDEDAKDPEDAPAEEPVPELSWDDAGPELPRDEPIPELTSDEAIPELASEDAIPELPSAWEEDPGPLWPDPALEAALTALDAGSDVTGAALDPDTARDVAPAVEVPDAATLVAGAALDDCVWREVLPVPELVPRLLEDAGLEEARDALVAPPPEEDVTPPDEEDEESVLPVQAPRHRTMTQLRHGGCLMMGDVRMCPRALSRQVRSRMSGQGWSNLRVPPPGELAWRLCGTMRRPHRGGHATGRSTPPLAPRHNQKHQHRSPHASGRSGVLTATSITRRVTVAPT